MTDIYVSVVSHDHAVCADGIYIAIASTTVETENPEMELQPAMDLLGDIIERFDEVSDHLRAHCGRQGRSLLHLHFV